MADDIQIHRMGGGGVRLGPDMNDPRLEMGSNFLKCARAGNLEKMLELLDNGLVDIDTSNPNGLNALHLACKEGHVHIVNELLARHMSADKPTKKGNTAMHIASMAGHENIIRVLVQYGAKVNAQSQNGFTPLYMAAQENKEGVVKYLLSHGASQSIATEDGFTPLSVALQQGHNEIVKLLMENDPKGKVKLPALHAVAKKDDLQAATLLIQKEPLKDGLPAVNETTKSGFTPLHIAAHYGSSRVGKLLLQNGADVNFKAKNAITPLHVACKWGKGDMVELLLDYDADIECKTRDSLTPIHCACRSGHLPVVTILVNRGSPVSTKTKSGLTPLHMAAQGDHVDCAEFLLAKGANIDDVTVDSLTPLHVAAHCGNIRMAKFLLDDKCDVNARALNGFTPLHVACKKNRIKVIELLLKYGAHLETTTESGLTPLHVSAFMGYTNVVTYLLERGANTEVKTFRGETALHLASRANQCEIMELLLKNGADVNAQAKEGQTALHVSARLGSVEAVDLLLKHGSARDLTTKDLYTPLHIAVKEGHEALVRVLLKNGANMNVTTKKGFTPLHLVARSGNVEIAKLLMEEGADPDVVGKNGLTPLHVATHYNSVDVAALLLERKASPHSAAKNGYTPCHIAAKRNQGQIAKLLLKFGAKINSESKNGFTPLHLAAQEGHTDVVNLLVANKCNVACRSKNGLTPMHLAAQEDKVEVAEILVDHKSPIDLQTKAGYTPLHTACHFGQLNMVKFLLEHGASVKASTAAGHTPLHQAAQQGHVLIIRTLLKYGADPDALTSTGQTPLSIAQHIGFISAVEALRPVTKHVAQQLDEYKKLAPETMQELALDSDDENGDKTLLADKSYQYLTVDDTKEMRYNTSYPEDKGDMYGRHSTSSVGGRDSFRDSDTPHSTLERRRPDTLKVVPTETTTAVPASEEDMVYIWNSGTNRSHSFKEDFPTMMSSPLSQEIRIKQENKSKLNGLRPDQLDHLKSHYLDSDSSVHGEFQNSIGKNFGLSPTMNLGHQTYSGSVYSDVSNTSTFMADNISIDRQPICSGFLVSFMVDARGGAMSGCRHSGVRVVVPPCMVCQPTRITCKMIRGDKLAVPIPLNDGESLATRILQVGPAGIKFTGSVLIELPHYASLRGQERELMIMRSQDGRTWQDHSLSATKDQVQQTIMAGGNFGNEDFEPAEKLYDRQVVRIVTSDFPRYFAVVTRYRLESKVVGLEGAILSSKVIPQAQAVFPKNAIQNKNIKVSLQVMPVDGQLVHSICGEGVTASPVVTLEPRHRKFHEPVTVTIPLPPESSLKGNKAKPDAKLTSRLRLLCSMTGGASTAKWDDITGSSPMTLTNDCVTFFTNISARFWLIEGTGLTSEQSPKVAEALYIELVKVPFLTKFVVFSKRKSLTEAKLRVFCTTDDNMEKTLENRQKFMEIAKSRDVEVFEGAPQNLDLIGNLVISQRRSHDGRSLINDHIQSIIFHPFQENRLQVTAKLRDIKADPLGLVLIIPSEPRLVRDKDGRCLNPACALNVSLPRDIQSDPTPEEQDIRLNEVFRNAVEVAEERVAKAEMRLTDIADELQSDWVPLARQLGFSQQEIVDIQKEYTYVGEQALVVLHMWLEKNKESATGNELERALTRIQRKDIIDKCMENMQEVTDDFEKKEALAQLKEELLKHLSVNLFQRPYDERVPSMADIQTDLNVLITDLVDMDCSKLDELIFKSLHDDSHDGKQLHLNSNYDCMDQRKRHTSLLMPEHYMINHNKDCNDFEESKECNDDRLTGLLLLDSTGETDVLSEIESTNEEDLPSLGRSTCSLVRRRWIEGEMTTEEERVVDDHVEEEGNFKVTQRVKMIRHVLPITEVVEFVDEDSCQVSEMISRRRVVKVDVEEEVDVCPKDFGGSLDSFHIYEENVKECNPWGRHKIFIHSRSSSFSEEPSNDDAMSGSVRSPGIMTDVEVSAEILPGNSLRTRRIVRTRSTPSPTFE